jgi:hypothetical protein
VFERGAQAPGDPGSGRDASGTRRDPIADEEAVMPQTIRVFYRPVKGRFRVNFNWGAIDKESAVLVTASEYRASTSNGAVFADKPSQPRFVGDANVWVSNIAPHGPPDDPNDGVTFVINVDWGEPIPVVADITVLDDKPIEVQYSDGALKPQIP